MRLLDACMVGFDHNSHLDQNPAVWKPDFVHVSPILPCRCKYNFILAGFLCFVKSEYPRCPNG